MAIKWSDIVYHTLPTAAVGIGMGFMAATALTVMVPPMSLAFATLAAAAALAFSWLWTPREESQHGVKLGGRQSQLEAFVPLIAGPIAFAASTAAFWIWPV